MRALVLVLLLAPALAVAGPKAKPAGDPFKTFVANLTAKPADAAKNLSDCRLIVLPTGEIVKDPRALTLAQLGVAGTASLVVTRVTRGQLGKTELEWVDADIEARDGKKVLAKLRAVTIANTLPPSPTDYPILAAHWFKPISDKAALDLTYSVIATTNYKDETVPAPKGTTGQDLTDYDDLLREASPPDGNMKEFLASGLENDGAVVIGSAPGERWSGKKGAKTIRAWTMGFQKAGGTFRIGAGRAHIAISHYNGVTPNKKQPVTVPYVGMVVFSDFMTGGGSMTTELALASFAIPQ